MNEPQVYIIRELLKINSLTYRLDYLLRRLYLPFVTHF